jgi:uncharacterized membrane protein YgcG
MSLDGLRAWIGEVEWKLGRRTRVFLVLAVIAIGGAGAAIVLAVDAQNSAVSEGDVRALQEELEAQIGAGGAGASVTQLETELKSLQAQVGELQEEAAGSGRSKQGSGGSSKGSGNGSSSGGASSQGTGSTGSGNTDLQDLLQRAKEAQQEQQK